MQTAKNGELAFFLADRSKDRSFGCQSAEFIVSYLKLIESGQYRLTPQPEAELIGIGRAIGLAVAKPVHRLETLSLSGLAAGGDRPVPVYGGGLSDALMMRHSETLARKLNYALRSRLYDLLEAELLTPLGGLLLGDGPVVDQSVRRFACSALSETFYFHLGYVLAGEKRRAAKLEPLVRLLAKFVPLGEKTGEKGTWIVLAA